MAAALRIGKVIGKNLENQQVWVTGHSLGGALAVLLAATLMETGIKVSGLYTFGAPRVGDEEFANRLNDELSDGAHWRVVNEEDLVPHLPPEMFFCHAGNRMLLLSDGTVNESKETWDEFKKHRLGLVRKSNGRRKLEDRGTTHA